MPFLQLSRPRSFHQEDLEDDKHAQHRGVRELRDYYGPSDPSLVESHFACPERILDFWLTVHKSQVSVPRHSALLAESSEK